MNYKVWYDTELKAAHLKIINMSTKEDVEGYMPALDRLLKDKPDRHVLVDLSDNPPGLLDKPARKAFRDYAESLRFDKIAMHGANPVIRMVAKVAVSALGMAHITKFFETKDEAIAWLKGNAKQ